MSALVDLPNVTITVREPHVPKEWYRTRHGLYVYSDYYVRIAEKAEPVEAGTRYQIGRAVVVPGPDPSADPNIALMEAELPPEHNFALHELCAVGATLVDNQPKGCPGVLDNMNATIAFVDSWAVWIYWDHMNDKWTFSTWPRGGDRFRRIGRVLFPDP